MEHKDKKYKNLDKNFLEMRCEANMTPAYDPNNALLGEYMVVMEDKNLLKHVLAAQPWKDKVNPDQQLPVGLQHGDIVNVIEVWNQRGTGNDN